MLNFSKAQVTSTEKIKAIRANLDPVTQALAAKGWTLTPFDSDKKQYTEVYVEYTHKRDGAMFIVFDLVRSHHSKIVVALDGWDGKHRAGFRRDHGFEPTNPTAVLEAIRIAKKLKPHDHYGIGYNSTSQPTVFQRGTTGPKMSIRVK